MKIILFIIALCLSTNFIFSQITTSEVDVSNFPLIDFTVSDRNPEILDKSSFNFIELIDGDKIESKNFNIKALDDTLDYFDKNKCVLILWETLSHDDRVEQNNVFYRSLIESLDNIVNDGDMIKIVSFSLNNIDVNILNDLHKDFTDDVNILKEALNSFELEKNDFTNKNVSEIYGALNKAIEELVNFKTDLPKSILLLSEEIQNGKPEGQNLRPSVVSQAQEKGIIINTIKYNRFTTHQQHDFGLAKETYGVSKVLSPSDGEKSVSNINDHSAEEKIDEAKIYIQSILNNTVKRSLGSSYSVSLKLKNNIKDGNDYTIHLKINDSNQIIKINYTAPGNWFIAQYQKNKIIVICVLELIFFVLLFIFYFSMKRRQKNKLKQKEQNVLLKQQEEEISSQKSELIEIKNKEEERKRIEEERKKNKEEKELIKQMSAKGFPVLKFNDQKGSINFEINKPLITVGRDDNSNICIKNNNISRHHFSIIYENGNYKIIDNNSTNGILINGKKVKDAFLNNTDIIEIADVSFSFFK